MKSRASENNKDDDRCSACPSEEGESAIKPLTGFDLYLMHKRLVDQEAELG